MKVYRKGKHNQMADALSRSATCLYEDDSISINKAEVEREQNTDYELGFLIQFLLTSELSQDQSSVQKIQKQAKSSEIRDGILMRRISPVNQPWADGDESLRIWIPESLTKKVIDVFHTGTIAGHLGTAKTYHRVAQCCFWKDRCRDIAKFVTSCHDCQETPSLAKAGSASSVSAEAP